MTESVQLPSSQAESRSVSSTDSTRDSSVEGRIDFLNRIKPSLSNPAPKP